ncbi:AzlC family ABC transporter permease [Aquabacter spiritensis]|uniref:AzlC family ABC transporter permease n=1 Tax=Aquabacter spiritensis TaxID=933073 RepID=UPI001FE21D45|nr:AzlC family ABC transporter permease [Aquabacter spiritensis]
MPPPASSPAPSSSSRWFLTGARAALSVPGLVLFAGYIGFGGLLTGIDFPFVAGLLSTLLIWALPAQIILIGGLATGTGLVPIALAVTLSSLRLMPMVLSLAPYLRGTRRSLARELLCAHFVAMTVWAEGHRLLPRMPLEGRIPFQLGLGCGLTTISLSGTAAGFFMAAELPVWLAVGLLFLTPISFSLLMIRGAREATDWIALALGFLTAPLVAGLSGGMDLMLCGIGGGTVAYLVGRRLRRRP